MTDLGPSPGHLLGAREGLAWQRALWGCTAGRAGDRRERERQPGGQSPLGFQAARGWGRGSHRLGIVGAWSAPLLPRDETPSALDTSAP